MELSTSTDTGARRGAWRNGRAVLRTGGIALGAAGAILLVLGWYWSREPAGFWVEWESEGRPAVIGYATSSTLLRVAGTLLDKPGGYLTNDLAPPGVFLDNIPNWEYGVLIQVRDLARVMRNDFSRSQTQSVEDRDLAEAEPNFNFDNSSWILPSSESRYRKGIHHLENYQARLLDDASPNANFYARADNLREWLAVVEKRLGNLSQQLSASVGQVRVNTDLAGDPSADASRPRVDRVEVKTPWLQLDDVFYEARGTAWALLHILRAIEYDFRHVLTDKNAVVSLRQVIRELEASLAPMRSPMVLNGSGFGIFPNHSLVMASYLSRANQAITNLRELLAGG
jgi:hypothetical protein